jgi:hypothetical protein
LKDSYRIERVQSRDQSDQSLAAQFSGKEFHALMEAWAVLKDRQTRAALLNLVKALAAAKR